MKKRWLLLLIVLLGSFSMAQQWTMHIAWPEGNFHTKGVIKLAELVSEKTNGEFNIDVNAGGALGFKGQEVLGVVRDGTLPIAEVFMGSAQGDEPIFGLTSVPLLVSSYDEAAELYKIAKPYYENALAKHNSLLLYAVPWPPSGIYTKNPLKSPDDLKNLKMRTYDSNSAKFAEGLGAQGLAIPFSELYTALSTGLINAVLTSSQTGVDASLWEVADYFTRINYAFPLNMVIVNKDAFNALSQDKQQALLDAAAEIEEMQWQTSSKADAESAKTLEANGMTVSSDISPELATAMSKVASDIEAEWLKLAGEDGKAVLDSFNKR